MECCGIHRALSLLTADQKQSRVQFAGVLQFGNKSAQSLVGSLERSLQGRVWSPVSIQVAGILLSPGDGLEIRRVKGRTACRIGGSIDKLAIGPITERRPCDR